MRRQDVHGPADEAIVRLAVETATRAEEILGMEVDDVDLRRGLATIRRGKGGRGRRVPFGPRTGQALDRYIRLRRSHRLAETGALWLGDRGKALAYYGLRNALQRRADRAGISGFHIHGSATPRRRGGWPQVAPRAALWP